MDAALAAHLATRSGPYAPLVGRFLLPASRYQEFSAAIPDALIGEPIRLGLIADRGADHLRKSATSAEDPQAVVELVECAAPSSQPDDVGAVAELLADVATTQQVFIELPRSAAWADHLESNLRALADARLGGKFRTGGVVAEAFPSEAEVAAFIQAAVNTDVPFKLTAGLHNALRHTDPATGFEHHGFLNVALAVADPDSAESLLAHRDPTTVAGLVRTIDASAVRSRWRAFGSCSIDEPVDDLVTLGLLERL